MNLAKSLRSAIRPIRASRIGRRAADELLIAQSWPSMPAPLSAALSWLTTYDMADQRQRHVTVPALVELFFGLVDGLGVERFVEAGAKEGAASMRAIAIPRVTEVVAFEANPYTHRRFASKLRERGVVHEHLALSDRDGVVEFLVRRTEDGRPIPDGQASLLERFDYRPGFERVHVDAVTLDGYFGAPSGVRTAIWMDVEGATSMVVRGGRELLRETDVAIVEVEERAAWEGQEWLRSDVVRELRDLGLVPLARDRQSRFQFNIVFVRDELRRTPSVLEALRAWRRGIRASGRSEAVS